MNVCGTVDTKSITNSRVPVRSLEYKMDDLTGFQRDLLYVIAGADQPSGQDVKSEVETYYNSEINHGRLYPNLDTLVNKDPRREGELDRRTNYYEISDRGRQTIEQQPEWEQQYIDGWSDTHQSCTLHPDR